MNPHRGKCNMTICNFNPDGECHLPAEVDHDIVCVLNNKSAWVWK